MQQVSGGVYWASLGKEKYNNLSFIIERLKVAIAWRTMRLIGKQSIWPFFFLSHYQVLFSEIIQGFCDKLSKIKNQDWHIHMHIMDLHDCRSINRLFHLIGRYKFFFKWLIERVQGNTKHRFIYASSLMYLDMYLYKLIKHMKKENIFDDTLMFVTADHGSYYAESPRRKNPSQGERTYYEHLEAPLIINQKLNNKIRSNFCDSMDVTASFLDLLQIPPHKSFKGSSIFKNKKQFIIAENAGSGNADIMRRDLYFTVINKDYKMMTMLLKKKFKILKLFNLKKDPKETNNLYEYEKLDNHRNLIIKLLKHIYMERKDILKKRGMLKISIHKS